MNSKIDWPNHLINFVLIVFSILLAFQLERCSQGKKEDALVDNHIFAIVEETRFNKKRIEATIAHMEKGILQIDTLLNLITDNQSLQRINTLSFSLLNVASLYIKKNAYQSFTQSGDIRFLDDFAKKSELINLYEYYRLAEANNALLMDSYKESYWKYMRNNFDLHRATAQPIEVYRARPFVNALSSYRYFLSTCIRVYTDCSQLMETFIENNEKA